MNSSQNNANNSVLPTFNFLNNNRIDKISVHSSEIISLIRDLNINKASGADGISGQMLRLCDYSVVLPLKIIFENIVSSSVYPGMWKLANVTAIFKKGDKQSIKNYMPISLKKLFSIIFIAISMLIIL